MEAKTYAKIPPPKFAKIQAVLATKGVKLVGNSGSLKHDKLGIEISFDYDGVDALTLKIVKKPFLVPSSMIWNEMQKAFKQHIPEPKAPKDAGEY